MYTYHEDAERPHIKNENKKTIQHKTEQNNRMDISQCSHNKTTETRC